MMDENLIKAFVAAKQLGKSSTTVRRMIQDKRLDGTKTSRIRANMERLRRMSSNGVSN